MLTITSRFEVAGLHRWPLAPDRRAYLRDTHRHLFKVTVAVEVGQADREVEFHDLGEESETVFRSFGVQYHEESTLVNFGANSCEMLAEALGRELVGRGYPVMGVKVSEDGENDGSWIP